MIPQVRFLRTSPEAILPSRGTSGAVGWDVYAASPAVIEPGQITPVNTGWRIAVPDGYEAQLRPRSGLARRNGITIANTPGTIDPDFRGDLIVLLTSLQDIDYKVCIGDRIAQLVVVPVQPAQFVEVKSFDDITERGTSGWGSTGR